MLDGAYEIHGLAKKILNLLKSNEEFQQVQDISPETESVILAGSYAVIHDSSVPRMQVVMGCNWPQYFICCERLNAGGALKGICCFLLALLYRLWSCRSLLLPVLCCWTFFLLTEMTRPWSWGLNCDRPYHPYLFFACQVTLKKK